MGTRSYTVLKSDGDIRIAQYGQWDGGIDRGGAVVWWFCKTHLASGEGIVKVKQALTHCHFLTGWGARALYLDFGFSCAQEATDEQWQAFEEAYPTLLRDLGPMVLITLMKPGGDTLYLSNQIDYYGHGWGNYMIDLDNHSSTSPQLLAPTLEVVEGGKRTTWSAASLPDLSTFIKEANGSEEPQDADGAWKYLVRLGLVGDQKQALLCQEDALLDRQLYPNIPLQVLS